MHCHKIHTLSQNTYNVTKYIHHHNIHCHKIHPLSHCPKSTYIITKVHTLSQKYIHYHRSAYTITEVHIMSQKYMYYHKSTYIVTKENTLSQNGQFAFTIPSFKKGPFQHAP